MKYMLLFSDTPLKHYTLNTLPLKNTQLQGKAGLTSWQT
jgi:hypothetical protein